MQSKKSLLSLENVVVRFGRNTVVDSVSMEIVSGEIMTLIGPNGSGKTTLVKAALGLSKINSGTVARREGLSIGYVPQHLNVDAALPLSVDRFLSLAGNAGKQQRQAALEEVKAQDVAHLAMDAISGGETRRVLLARALLRNPDLLILDEPTAGVDVTGQVEMYQLIQRIRDERNCGVLLVSHDLHLVMASTDKVVCLNHHVCCAGHPEDIARHPEYLSLFGSEIARNLAFYTHHHDHVHGLHGEVVTEHPRG